MTGARTRPLYWGYIGMPYAYGIGAIGSPGRGPRGTCGVTNCGGTGCPYMSRCGMPGGPLLGIIGGTTLKRATRRGPWYVNARDK